MEFLSSPHINYCFVQGEKGTGVYQFAFWQKNLEPGILVKSGSGYCFLKIDLLSFFLTKQSLNTYFFLYFVWFSVCFVFVNYTTEWKMLMFFSKISINLFNLFFNILSIIIGKVKKKTLAKERIFDYWI